MDTNRLYNKFRYKSDRLFSAFLRQSFNHFGKGSIIHYPNHIENAKNMTIGHHVIIHPNCWIVSINQWRDQTFKSTIEIKDFAVIAPHVQISAAQHIEIGRHCGISGNTVIVDHLHDYKAMSHKIMEAPLSDPKPVVIGDDVFIGVNCIVAPGTSIGEHTFIAANTVVSGTIPPCAFVAGNPGKVIRQYNFNTQSWEKV